MTGKHKLCQPNIKGFKGQKRAGTKNIVKNTDTNFYI